MIQEHQYVLYYFLARFSKLNEIYHKLNEIYHNFGGGGNHSKYLKILIKFVKHNWTAN